MPWMAPATPVFAGEPAPTEGSRQFPERWTHHYPTEGGGGGHASCWSPDAYANCCREPAWEKRLRIAKAGFSTSPHDTYPANQDAGTAANISQ